MKGAGRVVLDGAAVYGPYAHFAGMVRVCVTVDEFDRLGLCEGQWVQVELPGRESEGVLLVKALRVPPAVWLDLTARPVGPPRPARAAG